MLTSFLLCTVWMASPHTPLTLRKPSFPPPSLPVTRKVFLHKLQDQQQVIKVTSASTKTAKEVSAPKMKTTNAVVTEQGCMLFEKRHILALRSK